jgi:hypothetical protein
VAKAADNPWCWLLAVVEYFASDLLESAASLAETASASDLRRLLHGFKEQLLQQVVTWLPSAYADDQDVLLTGRRIGRQADCPVIAEAPLVTFRPGGCVMSSSSSNSSNDASNTLNSSSSTSTSGTMGDAFWHPKEFASTATPWLAVAARSMWLMGQVLSELLPASASSSSCASQQQRQQQQRHAVVTETFEVSTVSFKRLTEHLEVSYACVEWLGSQLCHMQLLGDDVATATSSSSSSVEDSAASMPLLTQLLQQHAQLQAGLYAAVQRCSAPWPPDPTHDVKSAAAASLLQRVWADQLPGQLRAFGAAVATALLLAGLATTPPAPTWAS